MLKECLPDHKNEKRFLIFTYVPHLVVFTFQTFSDSRQFLVSVQTLQILAVAQWYVILTLWRKRFSSRSEKQRSVQRTYVLLLLCWTPILYSLTGKIRCYWNKRVGLFVCDFLGLYSGFWWFGFFSFFLGGRRRYLNLVSVLLLLFWLFSPQILLPIPGQTLLCHGSSYEFATLNSFGLLMMKYGNKCNKGGLHPIFPKLQLIPSCFSCALNIQQNSWRKCWSS